jgi:hypothetical protein
MPVVQDTLWKHPGNPGMIVVTCHAAVAEDGRLVMEIGEAGEAARRIPGIELQCGQEVLCHAVDGVYGFLPVRPSKPEDRIIGFGLFQTQVNWDEPPDVELIRYSMDCLRRFTEMNNRVKIRMNFPGVGSQGLDVDEVAPLLLPLPQTVTVCHQGEVQPSMPANFPGFKAIYVEVERMLQEGRHNQAVEFLIKNGFDIQSAMNQVNAVQRILTERAEKEAERVKGWRQTQFSFYESTSNRRRPTPTGR